MTNQIMTFEERQKEIQLFKVMLQNQEAQDQLDLLFN